MKRMGLALFAALAAIMGLVPATAPANADDPVVHHQLDGEKDHHLPWGPLSALSAVWTAEGELVRACVWYDGSDPYDYPERCETDVDAGIDRLYRTAYVRGRFTAASAPNGYIDVDVEYAAVPGSFTGPITGSITVGGVTTPVDWRGNAGPATWLPDPTKPPATRSPRTTVAVPEDGAAEWYGTGTASTTVLPDSAGRSCALAVSSCDVVRIDLGWSSGTTRVEAYLDAPCGFLCYGLGQHIEVYTETGLAPVAQGEGLVRFEATEQTYLVAVFAEQQTDPNRQSAYLGRVEFVD